MLKISSIIFVIVALLTLVKAQDRAECDCRFDVFFAEYFCTCKNVAVFNNSYSLALKINHDGSLNNSDVTHVEYEQSTIQTNSRLLWTLFDNLSDFRLIRVGLENLTSFDECVKLQRIEIIGNKFSTISSGIFKKCSNLNSLLLYSNSIQEVKDAAFDGLASLKILDLSSNSIHEISRATFKSLSSLQYLNLDENQIEFIPDGAFDNHDQLLYLTMRSNKIAEIHPFSLQGALSLLALLLQNNKLTSIHPYTFRDLETLDSLSLSNNRIRKLDNFLGKSRNVTSIDLTGNQIDSIHPLFFRNISSVHLQIENNICVDMNFASLNGSSAESLPELQKCFENYNATTAPADNAKRCKFYRHEVLGYTCELTVEWHQLRWKREFSNYWLSPQWIARRSRHNSHLCQFKFEKDSGWNCAKVSISRKSYRKECQPESSRQRNHQKLWWLEERRSERQQNIKLEWRSFRRMRESEFD